jgi:hypothetical protein
MAAFKTTRRWLIAIAVLFLVASIGSCGFSSTRVCHTCGLVQHHYEHQLPLMQVTYWTSQSTAETQLSRMLRGKNLVVDHDHDWVFRAGGGNGIACAIGPARNWHCDTSALVSFLADVAKYDGNEAALYAKDRLLDRTENDPLMSAVLLVDYPDNGAASKDEYLQKISALRKVLKWRDSSLTFPAAAKLGPAKQEPTLPQ